MFKSMIEDPTHGPVVNATLEKANIIGKSYYQGITTVVNAVHDHQVLHKNVSAQRAVAKFSRQSFLLKGKLMYRIALVQQCII